MNASSLHAVVATIIESAHKANSRREKLENWLPKESISFREFSLTLLSRTCIHAYRKSSVCIQHDIFRAVEQSEGCVQREAEKAIHEELCTMEEAIAGNLAAFPTPLVWSPVVGPAFAISTRAYTIEFMRYLRILQLSDHFFTRCEFLVDQRERNWRELSDAKDEMRRRLVAASRTFLRIMRDTRSFCGASQYDRQFCKRSPSDRA